MHTHLLALLDSYQRHVWPLLPAIYRDGLMVERFQQLAAIPECFERDHLPGHITGSAMVVDPSFQKVLLTLHAKLGKWLQLGGHSDGHPIVSDVALREAREESGIDQMTLVSLGAQVCPFDLDIHHIPAFGSMPAHDHYDVRFLVVAGQSNYHISDESIDLGWFDLDHVKAQNDEPSMLRQYAKIKHLRPYQAPVWLH